MHLVLVLAKDSYFTVTGYVQGNRIGQAAVVSLSSVGAEI